MDFGRLHNVDDVDFALPAAHPRDRADEPTSQSPPRILLGGPLWAQRGFVGKLYPHGTPARDYLAAYARQFPTVELNTTWYRVDADQIARWADTAREAARDGGHGTFEFCPKLPKSVTHDLRLEPAADRPTEQFLDAIERFGDTRGVAWLLAPPGFGPAELAGLERYLERWAGPLRLAVELRERDWFADVGACDAAIELFRAHDVPWILTDVAGRRDVLHMCRTTREAFIRFIGNDLHATDLTRLDEWADRVAGWLSNGSTQVLRFYLHQQDEPLLVDLAHHFAARLRQRLTAISGASVASPSPIDDDRPRQGSLF